jgi:HK97 family phage prohead protease
MDHRSSRSKLIDVLERRAVAEPFEFRTLASGEYLLEGYAATWDAYDCYGGPEAGGWVEQLSRRSMDRTLLENPDVMLLVNHEGLPLARTKSGTLTLKADGHGLLMRAPLDPSDPDVQQIAPKMRRKDLDEMSFAFRVKDQVWNRDYTERSITELSLQKGDVSVVNYGMNPNTHATMSMPDMVGALAQLSNNQLCEVRSRVDRSVLHRAAQQLLTASAEDSRGVPVNFDGSHLLNVGVCVTCAGERNTSTLDKVMYADPGYLDDQCQPDRNGAGVRRWPVDETHVQASWQGFRLPRNQSGYTAEQVSAIHNRIKESMQKAGHDVNEAKSQDTVAELSHVEAVRNINGGTSLVAVMTDGTRTPLPSFRQSGELVGAGAADGGGPFGAIHSVIAGGGGGGAGGVLRANPEKPEDKPDEKKADGHPADCDCADCTGEDRKGKPPWLKGDDEDKPKDEKKTIGDQDPEDPKKKVKDEKDDRSGEAGASDEDEDDEPDTRSASERLRELRKEATLPDLPTVSEGLAYLRQLA